ncbi:Nuclear pore complex protein Nup93, partial [Fragariocoptes setiger]
MTTGFEDLLYQAQKLSAEVNNDPEMPRLRRNLPHLLEASSQLLNRMSSSNTSRELTEVRASVLLGSKGYDLPKVSRNLDSIISRGLKLSASTHLNAPIIRETDIQGFLKNERENAILQLIDEIKTRSREEVDKQLWHSIELEWEQEKVAILNAMVENDQDPYELESSFDAQTSSHSVLSTPMQTSFTNLASYGRNQGASLPFKSLGTSSFQDASSINSTLIGRSLGQPQSPYIERSIQNSIDPRPAKSNMDFVEIIYAKCVMTYVDRVVSSGFRPGIVESFISNIRKELIETSILDMWETVSNIIVASDDGCANLRRNINFQVGDESTEAVQENHLAHFKTLLLTGQFEMAVEYLFRSQRFRCHAVHVAIALSESGLLKKPEEYKNKPLLSKVPVDNPADSAGDASSAGFTTSLNFVNLITRYTKKFAKSNPVEAMYYFYLLRDCPSPGHENLFVTNVSELVRETKDFDNLLGYMSDFGRVGGVIDRFHQDVDEIATRVAEDCENSGDYEDAVKLYDLASRHGKVMSILSKLLSEVVTERKVAGSSRDRLEIIAMKIADRYCEPNINAPRDTAGTFYLLLDLMTFFNYYHNGQDNEALDTIQKLNLLPFITGEVELKAREFSKHPAEIRRNIAEILLATMNILHAMYKQAKATAATSARMSASDTQNREQQCRDIQQKARALITFSGMIQYRMPPDTISRLIELEVLIN